MVKRVLKVPFKHGVSPKIETIVKGIKRQSKTIQRNYVLNDVGALKNKLECEVARRNPFQISKEAKNGANVSVLMKTSFFEFTKLRFVEDIQRHEDILSIENCTRVKVKTEAQSKS